MRRWFLSYHSGDLALAERLSAAIEIADAGASVFLAKKSLRAGTYWQPALSQEIAEADAFVLLIGEHGLGPWQSTEYYEAHDKRVKSPDFLVVLMLLEGQAAPGLPFLRQLHWIVAADPASQKDVAQLIDAAAGTGTGAGRLWRYTAPYRGLTAMTEADGGFFFGRDNKIIEVVTALASAPDRIPVLFGNSGVGKSSLAQAGVLACLRRQNWPENMTNADAWPRVFHNSRSWCFLTMRPGEEPLRELVEPFLRTWQLDSTGTLWAQRQAEWVSTLSDGKLTLRDLLDATHRRFDEFNQPRPPCFFLYIDQGEELYVRAQDRQRRRFSDVLAENISDPRLRVLISLRSDFLGALQNDEPLYAVHCQINVPPLRETELREVVSRPPELLGARFETDGLAAYIAHGTAEESAKDAGALPLLSYLLDDMWKQMVRRDDGMLRLPAPAFDLGGVLVERADAFVSAHPNSEDRLRRIFTKLATVRQDEEPTRRRVSRSEFSEEEWRLVSELATDPNRLLVTATSEAGETYAEVAHEAVFRRWQKLRDWIAAEREFLAWRTGLEAARRVWQKTPDKSKYDAVLMGLALDQARAQLRKRADDIPQVDREFIAQSIQAAHRHKLRTQAAFGGLAAVIVLGFAAYWNDQTLKGLYYWFTLVRGSVLTAHAERMLKPGESFWECVKTGANYSEYCPEMVVVPSGKFIMGSPPPEWGRSEAEGPQHKVTIARTFAVSKFEVTFDQWDACVQYGGCLRVPSPFGGGKQPAINVSFYDAQEYVKWLSALTGQQYRLLSEAEWEYSARGGTTGPYSFEFGAVLESALGEYAWYGKNSDSQTHPVGEKKPNAFGLYDMHGNVWEWVEDCYHDSYQEAPSDGSPWTGGGCHYINRVIRGGAWNSDYQWGLRSAERHAGEPDHRSNNLGFRVGRTPTP
jgi:formylglycine-generating enzyme required for sulfatase activity